jgi:hypothetical protein
MAPQSTKGLAMFKLDHLAIAATTLAEGVLWVETTLGVPLAPGGEHTLMSTHNRLLNLGDLYLEVIAINPAAPTPPHPRWFDLDNFTGRPRLTNWIIACDDLDAGLAQMPGGGNATDLARGDLRWRMAIPPDGRLPYGGAHPALLEWQGTARPAPRLPDQGVRLTALHLTTPNATALRTLLAPLVDPRVVINQGPPALRAEFSTPDGPRVLE